MRRAAIVLVVLGLIVLAGCLQRLGTGSSLYLSDYRDTLSRYAVTSINQSEECRQGSCWCMVCVNGTRSLFPGVDSLIGGYCYFDKNCTPRRLSDLENQNITPNDATRRFMIGQGPTFGDYATANTYCSDRLNMAVQWLIGSNVSAYTKPSAMRAMCFLSKDVVPMYILYSNNTNISSSGARDIAQILGHDGRNVYNGILTQGPVGPVIVVTEMDAPATAASLVAEQVRAIDQGCGNDRANNKIRCFIAVSTRMNDFAALDALHGALGGDWSMVDMVAYGINGNYVHSCDGSRIRQQAVNFSSYSLYNHSKPTIIPYVLFDVGTSDIDNSCNWTEQNVVAAYGSFFPNAILSLKSRGVLGIAPYAFNTTGGFGVSNPLNCSNCGVGRTDARLRSWYAGCQQYNTINTQQGPAGSAGNAILFGNESGTVCQTGFNAAYLAGVPFTSRDIMQPSYGQLLNQSPLLFRCDECLIANTTRPLTSIFDFGPSAGGTITGDRECRSFPEIEQWASARNLDPMLVRAFILTESNFDPCSAAKVCSKSCLQSGCTSGCFPADLSGNSECYSKAYDEMYDPAGNCSFSNAAPGPHPDWRWCAFGLMQSLEPPYTFWPAQYSPTGMDGPYFDVFQRAGLIAQPFSTTNDTRVPALDLARSCNPNFNPFLPSDSICVGTAKLEFFLRAARGFINSHREMLGWGASDFDKDSLFAAYIAGNMYSGFWGSSTRSADFNNAWPGCSSSFSNGECWTQSFFESRSVNDTYCTSDAGSSDTIKCSGGHPRREPPYYCYGYQDFVQFVRECRAPFSSRPVDPGAGKVRAYISLSTGCSNNLCPDGKALLQAMNRSVPASGTPYVPDYLNGSNATAPP
ncbi:MAG: hypothetical protein U0R44_02820 [Candidatus Micrarchaeia archaeon]